MAKLLFVNVVNGLKVETRYCTFEKDCFGRYRLCTDMFIAPETVVYIETAKEIITGIMSYKIGETATRDYAYYITPLGVSAILDKAVEQSKRDFEAILENLQKTRMCELSAILLGYYRCNKNILVRKPEQMRITSNTITLAMQHACIYGGLDKELVLLLSIIFCDFYYYAATAGIVDVTETVERDHATLARTLADYTKRMFGEGKYSEMVFTQIYNGLISRVNVSKELDSVMCKFLEARNKLRCEE